MCGGWGQGRCARGFGASAGGGVRRGGVYFGVFFFFDVAVLLASVSAAAAVLGVSHGSGRAGRQTEELEESGAVGCKGVPKGAKEVSGWAMRGSAGRSSLLSRGVRVWPPNLGGRPGTVSLGVPERRGRGRRRRQTRGMRRRRWSSARPRGCGRVVEGEPLLGVCGQLVRLGEQPRGACRCGM